MNITVAPRRGTHRVTVLTAGCAIVAMVLAGCSGADSAQTSSMSSIAVTSSGSDPVQNGPPLTGSGVTEPAVSDSSVPSTEASVSESIPSSVAEAPPSVSVEASAVQVPTTAAPASTPATTSTEATPAPTTEPENADTGDEQVPDPELDPDAPFTGNPDNLALTAPGSQLKFTDTATIPFSNGEADGVFEVTGMSVTKGSQADWATLGVDQDTADGADPWYLRMTVKQVAGGTFSYPAVEDDLWAYSPGDLINTMYPDDDANPLCPLSSVPDTFKVGDSYQACVVLTVTPGDAVDRVQFEGGWADSDPYVSNPIVWKP